MTTPEEVEPTVVDLDYVRKVTSIMMTVSVAMVNLAMGASIGKIELRNQWRVSSGLVVGCINQFALFPVMAFGVSYLFQLPAPYRLGMLLVGICPGGSMANVVTFFIDGNICLSTSMVLVTTVISIGFVPLVTLIVTSAWYPGTALATLWVVAIAILLVAIPLACGMFIRDLREGWAKVVVVVGLTVGLLAFTANSLVHLIIHTELFHAPFRVYFATMFLPLVGYVVAFLLAALFGQHRTSRHTLAVQAVFHNTCVAIIILASVFAKSEAWNAMIVVPAIYGPITALYGIVYIIVYLAVLVNQEDNERPPGGQMIVSGYLPIDETPQGNNEYIALEGDDDLNVELRDRSGQLQLMESESSKSVYASPMSIPIF
ncbi:ileal sodium/bile acid cotransporter-like [Diadema antillarum]|uniref:ileal sodium/bile acid cotransporter-like n=1 Tax=Diadema antillarum TaxID=105358 RepID=UPI003A8A81EB